MYDSWCLDFHSTSVVHPPIDRVKALLLVVQGVYPCNCIIWEAKLYVLCSVSVSPMKCYSSTCTEGGLRQQGDCSATVAGRSGRHEQRHTRTAASLKYVCVGSSEPSGSFRVT